MVLPMSAASPEVVLAHGVGEVRGLPLPGELVLQTVGVVVLASFLAVALLWRDTRFAVRARDSVPATVAGGGVAADAAETGAETAAETATDRAAETATYRAPETGTDRVAAADTATEADTATATDTAAGDAPRPC